MDVHPPSLDPQDLDPSRLLLVIVGAHPAAEVADRPLARLVVERIDWWRRAHPDTASVPLAPLVLTDLWYLNAPDLANRPAICIGHPEHNAASAWLVGRLPSALVIQDTCQVQVDPEFARLQACVWGVNHRATAAAVDLFADRYLDGFLAAAHGG